MDIKLRYISFDEWPRSAGHPGGPERVQARSQSLRSRKSPHPNNRRCCPPRPALPRRWAARPARPRALPGRFPPVGRLRPRGRCASPPTASTPSSAIRKTRNAPSTSLERVKAGRCEANLDRWAHQFTSPDGHSPAPAAKMETRVVAGLKVSTLAVSGTYLGAGGMMATGRSEEAQLPHEGRYHRGSRGPGLLQAHRSAQHRGGGRGMISIPCSKACIDSKGSGHWRVLSD